MSDVHGGSVAGAELCVGGNIRLDLKTQVFDHAPDFCRRLARCRGVAVHKTESAG